MLLVAARLSERRSQGLDKMSQPVSITSPPANALPWLPSTYNRAVSQSGAFLLGGYLFWVIRNANVYNTKTG